MIIDLVFSLDSIITAVGMVEDVRIMIAAVIFSVALMMVFAVPIGHFVSAHPTIKMLAVEMLNIRLRRNSAKPVKLYPQRMPGD